jgi:hypothetical protein
MKYAINTEAIILFINGKNIRVEKTDRKYPKILQVFQLPKDQQESEVESILNTVVKTAQIIGETEGFDIQENEIFYKGEKLPKAFSDKVLSIIADGLPLEHFEKFWENLEKNPSYHVVNETGFFEFLEYRELPITEDGCFLAYRGVGQDYWSLSGDPSTKVLQGTTNSSGQIFNGIGEIIEVKRNEVNDDRKVHCAKKSLHIGSLDYAKNWGPKVVVVKVNPADVVVVPNDCSSQKCRVCKFEVISDFVEEITSSVVDESGEETLVTNDSKELSEFVSKIEKYIEKKRADGYSELTVRQIQNIFSPNWATKESILNALQELGLYWSCSEGVMLVYL